MTRVDVVVKFCGHEIRMFWVEHTPGTAFGSSHGRHAGYYAGKPWYDAAAWWSWWHSSPWNDLEHWVGPLVRDAATGTDRIVRVGTFVVRVERPAPVQPPTIDGPNRRAVRPAKGTAGNGRGHLPDKVSNHNRCGHDTTPPGGRSI